MNIQVEITNAKVPVTVLRLSGDLDGSTYTELIAKAEQLHASGANDMLIDMGGVKFMSSAGLVALHSIALMLRGGALPREQEGWEALRDVKRDDALGFQPHIKLLNLQPNVLRSLTMVGFSKLFAIFSDEAQAVASFG